MLFRSGFLTNVIEWFKSYLTNRTFIVNIDKSFSKPEKLSCGVPQGSILGPLMFLLYMNDIPQAVKSNILLYADDTCIFFQHDDVSVIEKQLNEDFSNLCDWFVDNKLSIHFGEDKTKSILFTSKRKVQLVQKLNITYNNIPIKQHASVSYLDCILDNTLSGESMALSVINKVNSKLRFLSRNKSFLNPQLSRLMCNALIQPHFDYASSTWHLDLTEKFKKNPSVSK